MAVGLKCPRCRNNTLSCRYLGEMGPPDRFLDRYEAVCSWCGYVEIREVDGGSPLGANWSTKCPFCGFEYCCEEVDGTE